MGRESTRGRRSCCCCRRFFTNVKARFLRNEYLSTTSSTDRHVLWTAKLALDEIFATSHFFLGTGTLLAVEKMMFENRSRVLVVSLFSLGIIISPYSAETTVGGRRKTVPFTYYLHGTHGPLPTTCCAAAPNHQPMASEKSVGA